MGFDIKEYAKGIVKNMRIGQKPNPNIGRARDRHGALVDKLLSKKEHKLSDFTETEQAALTELMGLEYGPLGIPEGR